MAPSKPPHDLNPTYCGQCFELAVRAGVCSECGVKVEANGFRTALPVGGVLDDKLVVGDVLGSPGGFGIAYLGWDRVLQRKVVIKELFPSGLVTRAVGHTNVEVMRRELQAPFDLQRELFLEEARKLARLEGVTSVVRVIHYFAQHGTAYFVMPWVPGQSLAEHVRAGGPMSLTRLLAWFWPLAEGLQAVHAAGLLHRDIKPENILLDDVSRPVLIDFGSAVTVRASAGTGAQFYAVSPNFAAPEQYANDSSRMGAWTDIYALGALIHFCLTGERPLDAQRRRLGEVLVATDSLVPGLSKTVGEVVARCMSMDPTRRPTNLSELLRLLEPLRPTRHWTLALPLNGFGKRMQCVHSQLLQRPRSMVRGFSPTAGALQWFWFLAFRLNLAGAVSGGAFVAVVAAVLLTGSPWQLLPWGVLAAWLIGFVPCALWADGLLFRRMSVVGASLPVGTDLQLQSSRRRLRLEGLPHPLGVALGFFVPLLLGVLVWAVASYQEGVRVRVARAIAQDNLRARIVEYQRQNGMSPSDADLDIRHVPDKELVELQVRVGTIEMVLAVSGASNRRIRWRQQPPGSGAWLCEARDLEPQFTPSVCVPVVDGKSE